MDKLQAIRGLTEASGSAEDGDLHAIGEAAYDVAPWGQEWRVLEGMRARALACADVAVAEALRTCIDALRRPDAVTDPAG